MNVFNVHWVITFVPVLIPTVVLAVRTNDRIAMVFNEKLLNIFWLVFSSLGNAPNTTPSVSTLNPACSSNLCTNRGTCQQNAYGGIQCNCIKGWFGSRCQYGKFFKIIFRHQYHFSLFVLAVRINNDLKENSNENNSTTTISYVRQKRT